ncbi:divergent polysaccharide deacetylase family protein [Maribrevibacterium harenarium]|uniref:Divergent polysaccharide deacetylase family protein n=1 Tax=Maribrevibacterium harenarium TaxID=2589817 RepID=A0A501X1J3_9GAMM|nr:divergent polysaccharide deacetylase family protein [Maribrevibacterium harenarium]TPE54346.1 divergent polysaccharide deacetylase family protein [Maribrevibacterium harenarium]
MGWCQRLGAVVVLCGAGLVAAESWSDANQLLSERYPVLGKPEPSLPLPMRKPSQQPLMPLPLLRPNISAPELNAPARIEAMRDDVNPMDASPPQPMIGIIIDDVGYNRRGMEQSLALPVAVALAILPQTPFGRKTAIQAQEQQRITLLHAPMENERALKLGPGGLYVQMDETTLKQVLMDDLAGLPGVQGVNNHMGSLLTAHPEPMQWVMEVLQRQQLFFVDSLTNPNSVAGRIAKEHGLPTATRQVFLDNIRTPQQLEKQFQRLIKFAHRNGFALAIGHPYPETMAYLNQRLRQPASVRLVPLSELLH